MKLPWVALAVGLMTAPSFAEEKTALVVIREAGAETCPDAVQVAAHVNAIVAREVIGPGPGEDSAWIEVTMHRAGEGYGATVRTYGRSVGQRQLSDAGPGCTALGEAVAVSLALMWTSQEEAPAPEDPPPATEEGTSSDPVAPPEPAQPAATPKHPPARRAPRRAPTDPWLRLGVDALVGVAASVLEHPAPGGELGVRADLGTSASFGIVAGGVGPDRIDSHGGSVTLSLLFAALRACVGVIDRSPRVWFCLRPTVGRLAGAGTGFDESWEHEHVQPALGVGVELRGRVTHALGWAAELVATAPLERQGFSVVDAEGEHTVFSSPNLGVWALVGVSWELY